jgi:hypothetical protein
MDAFLLFCYFEKCCSHRRIVFGESTPHYAKSPPRYAASAEATNIHEYKFENILG